jgi:cell division protein FtsB
VVTQNAKNAALEEHIRNSDDKGTVLEIAKEKLGLVEEGEVVFYDTTN